MAEDETKAARHTRAVHLLADMEGYEGSELAKSRVNAWNYYFQRPRGDEVEGRSPVVTGDVSAMVESTLSQVAEALATDRLAEFEGENENDEFQAQLEGATVSRMVMRQKGWFRLASSIKNALLLRMGVIRAEIVESEEHEVTALENVDALALTVLEQVAEVIEYDPETQTASMEEVTKKQSLRIVNVNSENFLFVQWPLDDFENIPACAERFVGTRQYLIDEEGIDEKEALELPLAKVPEKSDDSAHSLRRAALSGQAVSKSQEVVEWFVEYYLYESVRYRAIVAANRVLSESTVSRRPPFAIGVPLINPGRTDGISIFDKLRSTQDITTALTRMLHDNAEAVTMNRLAVLEGASNGDQLTDQDPSGVLQIRKSAAAGDIRNAVMPIQTMDMSAGIVTGLNYQRTVRSEMAGASLDVGTGKVQLPDRMGSMGLDRAYTASEQLSSLILKTFSQTLIKDLWLLVHDLLRTQWTGPLPMKINGRWETPIPSQWKKREEVIVKPGMSPGERQRRVGALGSLVSLQTQLAQSGMEDVLVDAERYYRTICDWGRLNDIPNPEQYLIDPTSKGAIAAMERKAAAAKAQQDQAARLQQMALALEQMDKALNKYATDVKAAIEKYKVDATTDQKEAELTIDLVKSREQSEQKLAETSKQSPAEAAESAASDSAAAGGE